MNENHALSAIRMMEKSQSTSSENWDTKEIKKQIQFLECNERTESFLTIADDNINCVANEMNLSQPIKCAKVWKQLRDTAKWTARGNERSNQLNGTSNVCVCAFE